MHVAEIAIKRWQLTLVLFALLAALGYSAFTSTPRSIDPHFNIPVVTVVAAQPGADAAEIEQTITKPIEEILQGLDDVEEIRSTSSDGSAVITTEFDWTGDPEEYFNDVVREISAVRDRLPESLAALDFTKAATTNPAIIQVALVSETASWYRMEKYARDLKDAFARLPNARETEIYGLPQPEVTVAIDAGRLAELRLPVTAVADSVRQGGADIPGGSVTSGSRRFNVETGGAFRTLESVRNLPLRSASGSVLRVGDVADVQWGSAEERVKLSHNGRRALFITANQKKGADATTLRNQLVEVLEQEKKILPQDIEAVVQFDQSKDIQFRLRELARDFSIAIFLVIFTLLPLGLRASLIVMISIPLSLASGLLANSFMGWNLSQLVVAGFILSLGLLVDDSIVVVENISRHLRMGKSRDKAAIDATKEITKAVLGSTGVLVFAFLPMLFLPEGAGQFTKGFIGTIIFTVSASMIVSLTIVPFLASRILSRDADPEGNALLKWMNRNIERIYKPALHRALNAPRRTVWSALLLTGAAFFLVPVLGFSLFPDADTSYFRVTVDAEQGSSIAQTESIIRKVSAILATEPDIKVRAENVGRRNPQIFYNVFPFGERINEGEILAVMDRWRGERSKAMVARIRKKLDEIPGARIKLVIFQNGSPINAPVEFRIIGPNLDKLKELAGIVEDVVHKIPGTRDVVNQVSTDRVDLDLDIDDAKAALLDIPAGAPRRAVRLAINGEAAGNFRDEEGDSYPVTVRLPLEATQPVSAIEKVYVPSRAGRPIALSEISDPKLISQPPSIRRYNLERFVSISAQLKPGFLASKVNQDGLARLSKIELPEGYRIEEGGEAQAIAETFGGFGPVIMFALFAIFAILVAEFGRFREALVVAGVIPLGTFGGLLALLVTGNNLSFLAVIGFVALIGIEIKNSILLVDFTTQLRDQGMKLREAIEKAGEIRFMPVLLTSITAIGGLMPLAILGGSLYSPLAIVLIGGLISSTILSRIVTPTMYLLVVRGVETNGKKPHEPAQPALAT